MRLTEEICNTKVRASLESVWQQTASTAGLGDGCSRRIYGRSQPRDCKAIGQLVRKRLQCLYLQALCATDIVGKLHFLYVALGHISRLERNVCGWSQGSRNTRHSSKEREYQHLWLQNNRGPVHSARGKKNSSTCSYNAVRTLSG